MTKVSPAELSAPDLTAAALKRANSRGASVTRSNEVKMLSPLAPRSVAGGAICSAEHPRTESDNAAKTPNRAGEDERIRPLAMSRTDEG